MFFFMGRSFVRSRAFEFGRGQIDRTPTRKFRAEPESNGANESGAIRPFCPGERGILTDRVQSSIRVFAVFEPKFKAA